MKLEDWDKLSVSAYDITGKMLDVNYVWEAESGRSGITLTADGTAAFTEGGTYRVRVRSGNVVSLWKEITVLDHAKVTTAPKTYSFVYDGKTHYLLDEPGVAPNGTMVYAVTQSKDEIAAFSDAIPTATEVGVYYVWYKAAGFEGYVDSEAQYLVAAVTDGSVYFAASGEGQEYLHGGNDDAQFTVKRVTGDENTFALFTGIQMDGVNVDQTNYEAWQGSVVIRLKNAYLDKLSGGSHILKVLFTDGSVEIPFTVSRTVDPTKFDDVAVPSDSFTFKKVWEGGSESSIDFTLYKQDGTVYHHGFDKKAVSKTEWQYNAWFSEPAACYVIEQPVEGYKTRYENVGVYAGITDRCCDGGTIVNYRVPKTGDEANLILWAGCSLAGLGLVTLAVCAGKRKKAESK